MQQHIVWDQLYNTIYRYPYMVQLANAWPDGWQGGTQAACPSGLVRVANGGGCGPSGLASTVFVGPYATVLSTATVSGNAQIQDHATIVKGTVTGGTSRRAQPGRPHHDAGQRLQRQRLGDGEDHLHAARLLRERPVPRAAARSLIGDVEFRGVGFTESAGTFYGFVDNTIKAATSTTDVTMAGPYTWRN